jgi:hypothetical protein
LTPIDPEDWAFSIDRLVNWRRRLFPRDREAEKAEDEAHLRALARDARRAHRERLARQLSVIKAARKAGLPVKRATVEGVELEFGKPESAPAATVEIETPEQLRRLI